MPSVSKNQQKFMGIVRSIQKGEQPAGKFSKDAQKTAKKMKKSSVKKYAKTKHDDLPVKKESLSASQFKAAHKKFKDTGELPPHLKKLVKDLDKVKVKHKVKNIVVPGLEWMSKIKESLEEAERDYKDEYKKFQSSTKAKKYRAELNKYNRKKGTYGNGDGKDASHKGGKIVGFESQSKNRGRAEKSRLKKESRNKELTEKDLMNFLMKRFKFNKKKAIDTMKKAGFDISMLERFDLEEACQKGYMTHPTRKTKVMFGKRYRNCVKKEGVDTTMTMEQAGMIADNICVNCGDFTNENLRKWFKDRWVNIGKKKKGGGHPPCGSSGKKRGYAKCVPASKAASMSKKQKASATRRKRAAQNKAGRGGTSSLSGGGKKPIRVSTKPKK